VLTSIIVIKLRSPEVEASSPGRAAQRRSGGNSIAWRPHHRRPAALLRGEMISRRQAKARMPHNLPAPARRGTGGFGKFFGESSKLLQFVEPAQRGARPGAAHCLSGVSLMAAGARRRRKRGACHGFAPLRGAQDFIPFPAKPPRTPAARPSRAIAPPARRVNVGLTVNRDDHVTKIPVVFVSGHPAKSGE